MKRMPFGKYKGVLLGDLPDDYVRWLHDLSDLREPLRTEIEAEFQWRFTASASRGALTLETKHMAQELLSAGYRKLAAQYHPDRGGNTATMQSLNAAMEFLRRVLRERRHS